MLKNKLLPLLILLFALFSGCRQNASTPEVNSRPQTNSQANSAPANNEHGAKVKIKTPDERDVVEIKIDPAQTKLEYGGKVLRGTTDGDKRKYSFEGGSQIAEVKAKEADGFKVRTPDGKLLWKIKISADKIKISDNEENQNAFEIIKKDDGAKIERNEQKLGEVKFYRDRGKIKVKDVSEKELFDANTDKYSISYGVLLLDKIPEESRFIIIAELLARNL